MSEKLGAVAEALTISDADFNRLVNFVRDKYGIDLRQKRQLITSRLGGTVKSKGFKDFKGYVDYLLKQGTNEDVNQLLAKLTTNYTYFQRETDAFDFFTKTILPQITQRHQKDKSLAIWSAGCASGEEPYNISLYLLDYLGSQASSWDTRILATDISVDALSKAKAGVYELPESMPKKWKLDYFTRQPSGLYAVGPKLRNNVIFQQFNLMDPIKFRRKFDVIFCRNVMIYFDQETKDALVRRFYEATNPGGYLLISLSENLSPNTPYRRVATSIFQKN